MFREMRRFKQHITDEECREVLISEPRGVLSVISDEAYIEHEVKNALPRALCLELTPEHITGKLVNES